MLTLQLAMIKAQRSKHCEAKAVCTQCIFPSSHVWDEEARGREPHTVLAPTHLHLKTTWAVPISVSSVHKGDFCRDPHLFIQPYLQNGVFSQDKAREKPVVPHVKTERPGHQLATHRPPNSENSLNNVGMEDKRRQRETFLALLSVSKLGLLPALTYSQLLK